MFSQLAISPYAPPMAQTIAEAEDDAALARRIIDCAPKRRDAAAEAELCRRLGPRIRLYGLKHLRSEAAAADLMQDVLILLLDKLREGAVRDPEQVVSFALGTARQTVVDWRRGASRRTRILEKYPIDLVPQAADEEGAEPIDAERLRACLGALPERERTVLVMTFYDDRPADAVAQELKLSPGNVRVIRHRGLERLRGCMTAAGGEA
jgi:RNA polymerase sigma-70 factor (ECF subfamily)